MSRPRTTRANYDDQEALGEFAAACDVVTFEFENVPDATAHYLADHVPVAPDSRALAVAQDRLLEKNFVAGLGIATAPFRNVLSEADAADGVPRAGRPRGAEDAPARL